VPEAPGGGTVTGLPAVPHILAMPRRLAPLQELRRDWGDAYLIYHDAERGWWGARRDQSGTFITAPGHETLRSAVRAGYGKRPVPREVAP
jgi:DNA-binding transcriptional LysR family regulator